MEFKVGVEPDQKIHLRINTQEKLKQYGLQRHVSITVNAVQGEILSIMSTEVYFIYSLFLFGIRSILRLY